MTRLSGLSRHPSRSLVSSIKKATRSIDFLAVPHPADDDAPTSSVLFPNPGHLYFLRQAELARASLLAYSPLSGQKTEDSLSLAMARKPVRQAKEQRW